jgi:OOP family OmpA-OmpF porin
MFLCRPWGCGLCVSAAIWTTVAAADAEPLRFHAQGGGARAIAGEQQRETALGIEGEAAVELGLSRALGVELALAGVALGSGDPPLDPTLERRSSTSGQALLAGLRIRPFAASYDGRVVSAAGLWLDAGGGAARTGDLMRGAFAGHVGFDFMWDKVAVGPYAGYLHILQPDDTLRPDDASLLLFGVHLMLGSNVNIEFERDRDGDGIPDPRDKCPDEAEDKDGFEDSDGCPDPDNDKDDVKDFEDACPNQPGKRTTDPKTNGCPVGDRDKDGIPDDEDKCPDEPEDKDGFWDEDGCPDPDNDKDGIPDTVDKCPNEPETLNGYADERGEEGYNQKLSEARARAVRELLIRNGVSRERLSAVGFGTSNPRIPEKSDKAYRQNRRVEFKITREKKDVVHTDAVPPAPASPAKEGESR